MKQHLVVISIITGALGLGFLLIPRGSQMPLMYMKGGQFILAKGEFEKQYASGNDSVSVAAPLAELYLHFGEINKAINILERYLEEKPQDTQARKILANVYRDAQRIDEHLIQMETLLNQAPDEREYRNLYTLFKNRGQSKKQLETLQKIVQLYPGSSSDYIHLAYLQANEGLLRDSVKTLETLDALHPVLSSPDKEELHMSLLLDTGNSDKAKDRAQQLLTRNFDAPLFVRFVNLLKSKGQENLSLQLLQYFATPVEKYTTLLRYLIDLEAESGRIIEALARLEKLFNAGKLSGSLALTFVELLLEPKNFGQGLHAEKNFQLQTISTGASTGPDNRFLTAKNRELVEKILARYGEGFLSERPLLAARLMFALQKESSALAWMKQAESSPVLTLEEQIEIAGLYGQLGPTHPARLTLDTKKLELGIAEALQAPGLPQPRKEELVTALLDLGARRRALPYLKHLADNAGGDWADAYEETLLNLGRKEELFKFWRQRVKKPDLPDEERRQIAYQFLDAGYKAEAEQALLVLAATASPNGPDVEQLLFLWGPRPGREAKKWLLEKAGSASGDERAEWMHHLVEAGGAEEVVALLQKEPSAARSEKIFTVYLDALEDLRSGPELVAAINNLVALEHSPDKLLRYGKLAEEREQLEAAQAVYKKILQIQPGDGYALNQLGQMAFYENRWKETQDYLGRYLSTNPNDWEAYYTYAEAGYLQEDIAGAKQYYQRALEILEKSSEKTFPMEMAQADCLRRLGNPKQALTIYQSLLKKRPDDNNVKANMISSLMDLGEFDKAQQVMIANRINVTGQ